MIDRGKVIRPLQAKLNEVKADGLDVMLCSTEIIENAISMLKEQEEQIKNRDESLEKAREEIKWLRGMLKERNDNFDLYDTPIFGFHD